MHWNLRVVQIEANSDTFSEETYFEIREVMYDDEVKPFGHRSAVLIADTPEELPKLMEKLKLAIEKPILTKEDFN